MLQGTLDEFPLIDVLGILKARNKTGRLDIERQAGRGLIYVRLGEPYYAESSLTRSLIGQKLVDIGAITDMQLRKALDRQAESGDRLGQVLLTHGVISREHIASAVISQIKDALADLLAWETGEFRWEVGAEVEVEVPVHGGMLDSDKGSIPMAPHVVPVIANEPAQAPPVAQPIQGPEHALPDFRQSGSALNGSAATAPQIDQSPRFEPQVQPQLEVVHSHSVSVGGGSTDEESPPVPFDQAAAEPELHTAVDETEQHEASEMVDGTPDVDETIEFEPAEPVEHHESQSVEDEPTDESEPDESEALEDESTDESVEDEHNEAGSHEDEPVEVEAEPFEAESVEDEPVEVEAESFEAESHEDEPYEAGSHEDEPYEAGSHEDESVEVEAEPFEAESVEDEPYEAGSHEDEPVETEPHTEEPVENGLVEGDSDHDSAVDANDEQPQDEFHEVVKLPRVEVVESLNGTRVIKSNPAPEFDEEFDQMFETAAGAVDEQVEPEAPSFETEPEAPSFETEPVAESPLDEVPFLGAEITEIPAPQEAPSFEPAAHQPVASFGFAPVENDTKAEAPQSPVPPAPEPMATNPPPPPPVTAPPVAPMAQVTEATEGRSNDDTDRGVPGEPASDIKLDRSSLVRELSDLLR